MSKRTIWSLSLLLLLVFILAPAVLASKPEPVAGFVPFASYFPGPPGGVTVYDVCDAVLQGQIEQPAETPGKAVHGTFTMGDSPFCDGVPEIEGTCEFTLLPVEEPGNPDSKEGFAVLNRCTGDLQGLHGTFQVHFDFTYDAMYHVEPQEID